MWAAPTQRHGVQRGVCPGSRNKRPRGATEPRAPSTVGVGGTGLSRTRGTVGTRQAPAVRAHGFRRGRSPNRGGGDRGQERVAGAGKTRWAVAAISGLPVRQRGPQGGVQGWVGPRPPPPTADGAAVSQPHGTVTWGPTNVPSDPRHRGQNQARDVGPQSPARPLRTSRRRGSTLSSEP